MVAKNQIPCVCEQCGANFTANLFKIQDGRARFCSKPCFYAHRRSRPKVPLMDRFWSKVSKSDGCWNWTASITNAGYGLIDNILAHRLSYETHIGPITDGRYVCHKCDNRACVNPEHLFLGTPKDNQEDMARKNRNVRNRKLNTEKIRAIRKRVADGASMTVVGREFGVSATAIQFIISGKTWRHVS